MTTHTSVIRPQTSQHYSCALLKISIMTTYSSKTHLVLGLAHIQETTTGKITAKRIAGQTTFKVVDEKNARLVANGATSYMGGALVPSKNYIRFDIRASVKDKDVTLVFSNIRRLFQDTGSLSNDGFTPVGVWYGSDADGAVQALEVFAESVKTCISSWK